MTQKIKDQIKEATNGEQSAFPYSIRLTNKTEEIHIEPGMTLRDYFAGKAMQGMLSNSLDNGGFKPLSLASYPEMAKMAYAQSDAMMKVREEGKGS